MTRLRAQLRTRRLICMVTLVGLVAATSWFALTGQGPGNFAPRPPWLGDPSKLPDVIPIRDNTGTIIGWTYIEQVPVDVPDDEVQELPAHIKAKLERQEYPVVWIERPGVTTTFTADGGIHTHINDDVADPRHRDPGDHPIFPTKAAAEQYAATKR